MRRNLIILACLLLLAVVASQFVLADQYHKDSKDLTAEQQTQIAEIHKASKVSIKALLTPEQLAKLAEIKAKGAQCADDYKSCGFTKKLENVDPTGEQSKKVAEICQASAQKCKVQDAGKDKQGGSCPKEAKAKIRALLTPQQLAKLEQTKGKGKQCGADGGGACRFKKKLEKLDLTEKQSKKIAEICEASAQKCKLEGADKNKQGGSCPKEAKERIKALLTPEQLAKLEKPRDKGKGWGKMLKKLELTEEQQGKISAIRKAAKAQAKEADGKESRKAIFGKMKEDINAVLSADQQKKLTELKKAGGEKRRWRKRDGGPRGHGAGFKKALAQLDLSEEQEKRIAEIRKETREKIKAVLTQKP